MNQELLDKLKVISPEEEQILAGETEVQKSIYTAADDFIVDGSQMLDAGKLIDQASYPFCALPAPQA